jgi:Zn ribbon nucleic-acid-binding protein
MHINNFKVTIECEKCGETENLNIWNYDERIIVQCKKCGNKSEDEN